METRFARFETPYKARQLVYRENKGNLKQIQTNFTLQSLFFYITSIAILLIKAGLPTAIKKGIYVEMTDVYM